MTPRGLIVTGGIALLLALAARSFVPDLPKAAPKGCARFTASPGPLVAHAGGGTPDAVYRNDRVALDLADRHGFKVIELDFMEKGGRLALGHGNAQASPLTLEELLDWLDRHPGISIITDIKTDNLNGLKLLKAAAGRRIDRFIPQIYSTVEFAPVVALGYPAPILTIYRLQPGKDEWIPAANALPLRAVTMPVKRRALAGRIEHPVYLHTVNQPMPGYGLYTDCLIPADPGSTDTPEAR